MRRLGFLITCLAFLFVSCNEAVQIEEHYLYSDQTGRVTFSLSADLRNENVSVKSSSAENISKDDFWVEIFTQSKTRIFCEKYVDAKDTVLNINSGEYRFLATYGSENASGFNKPFYKADTTFTVGSQETVQIEAVAKLANVKVSVDFSDNLNDELSYDTYYALVRKVVNGTPVKKLKFMPNETRAGYIPAGDLEFILYVMIAGEWKQYVVPAETYNPNDHVTFRVEVGKGEGDIVVKISIDDDVEVVTQTIEIPASAVMPFDAPLITSFGFDEENEIVFEETKAEDLNELWISAYAEGVIASAELEIISEELQALGVPESVDLVTASASVISSMEEAGIWWTFSDDMRNLAIDVKDAYNEHLSDILYKGYDQTEGSALPVAEITLNVTAESGAAEFGSDSFRVIAEPAASSTISWNDYDVWATKIVNPVINVKEGQTDLYTLEGSADGQNWVTVGIPSVDSLSIGLGTIADLNPGTEYYMRAVYDGWYPASEVYTFVTESAVQIADSGFENWTTQTHKFEYNFVGTWEHNIDWYYPASGWGVNSKKTMPSNTSVLSANWNWVRFPMVAYTTDAYSGSYSAMVYSVSVGDGSSSIALGTTKESGKLWTGAANSDGSVSSTQGLSLESRPTSLKFHYKYKSVSGETFVVNSEVRDQDGKVIASASTVTGPASSSWKEFTLNFEYSVTDRFADSIYLYFCSSNENKPNFDAGSSVVIADNRTCEGNFGSILHIDDIQLIY